MAFQQEVTSAALPVAGTEFPFGSITPDHNRVAVWADTQAIATQKKTKIAWRLYVTQSGITTLAKEFGPFDVGVAPYFAGAIEAIPGASYQLKGIVTYGAVSAVAVKAGLTAYDDQVDTALDAAVATHTLTNVDQLFATISAYHTKYQVRLDFNGANYPASRWRLYASVAGSGGVIKALVEEYTITAPPKGGTMALSVESIGALTWELYGASIDPLAVGAQATTVDAVLIGFDRNLDGAGGGAIPLSLSQTAWYINPLTGNNTWDGTAAVHVAGTNVGPIATFAEYINRTGLNRPIANPVDIYLEADLPATDPVIVTGTVTVDGGYINIHGSNLTVAATGTLDAYTPGNAAANTLPILNDLQVADWTPYFELVLRLTSGPQAGNDPSMWIIGNDVGLGNADISQPCYRADAFTLTEFVPVGNETYEILFPRLIAGGIVWNVTTLNSVSAAAPVARMDYCVVRVGAVPFLSGPPVGVTFFNCWFAGGFDAGNKNTFMNCQLQTSLSSWGGSNYFYGGYWNTVKVAIGGNATLSTYYVALAIRGGSLSFGDFASGSVLSFGADVQISGTTNYFAITQNATMIVNGQIYGNADAAIMYNVAAGSKILLSANTNLRVGGTTFDIKVAGKTSVFPYDAATGVPQAVVQVCSLANFVNGAFFAGNIVDPFTGPAVLTV